MSDVQVNPRRGRYYVRWREGGRRHGRTFDRKGDAQRYATWVARRRDQAR